ncbi:MAG TPA: hypothetical protein VNX21_09030 [Candidatus Thermoplasmatota archaeon]|nr:hypothetical protein [Candidatus Thermoplasmatota archaeon]
MAMPMRPARKTDGIQAGAKGVDTLVLLGQLSSGMGRTAPDALSAAWLVAQAEGIVPPLGDFFTVGSRKVVSGRIHQLVSLGLPEGSPKKSAVYDLGRRLSRRSQSEMDLLARYLFDSSLVHPADLPRAQSLLKEVRAGSA